MSHGFRLPPRVGSDKDLILYQIRKYEAMEKAKAAGQLPEEDTAHVHEGPKPWPFSKQCGVILLIFGIVLLAIAANMSKHGSHIVSFIH